MYIGVLLPDGKKHCTLTFHGHRETEDQYIKSVAALANTAAQWHELTNPSTISLEFGEVGLFESRGAWYAEVFSPGLMNFRQHLSAHLDAYGLRYSTEFEYKPHVTLTYFKKPKTNPYQGLTSEVQYISVVSNEFGITNIRI